MKCILFDLDGTLADTEVLKAKAIASAVGKFGRLSLADTYKSVVGQSWEKVTDAFFQRADIQIPLEAFNPVFREQYCLLIERELADVRGASSFIRLLKRQGILVGLVSSASPWMIQKVLHKLGMENEFSVVVSNQDTRNHKPDPEAYLLAMSRLGVLPEEVIAFEDSESGFRSATSAGLSVFGVIHEFNLAHDFSMCRGTLHSFEECLAWRIFSGLEGASD